MVMLSPPLEYELIGSTDIMRNEMKIWGCLSAYVAPRKKIQAISLMWSLILESQNLECMEVNQTVSWE